MATKTAGQSKSAFVRDFIGKNPTANRKSVEQAWHEAGHEGPISSALVSNLRRELGLTGTTQRRVRPADGNGAAGAPVAGPKASRPKKRRRRRKGKAGGAEATPISGPKPSTGGRAKGLAEIEEGIDRLIIKLMAVGGFEGIEHELRKVRRLLYRRFQE
ncbi:MAG TPA: hypothetical protein VFF52_10485 [Isosphaeraceae bacterium]|nr:hypothetical protein [Isosphaeraceae bacterium]